MSDQLPDQLPMTARVAIAMGLDKVGAVRAIAVSIVTRFVLEFHRHGFNQPGWEIMVRVSRRWRLGDYSTALLAHYPPLFWQGGRREYVGLDGRVTPAP